MRRRILTAVTALGCCLLTSLHAQEAARGPTFEVASVRPSPRTPASPLDLLSRIAWPPGRFTANRTTVRSLIQFAHDMPDHLVDGGPGWARTDRFDITAAVPDGTTVDDRRAMLRTLLAERFGLVVHEETRELPAYDLVMARDDRRPGPHLTRPDDTVDCAQVVAKWREGLDEWSRRFRESPSLLQDGPVCDVNLSNRPTPDGGHQHAWSAGREPMAALANYLSERLNRPVLDRTGLSGEFDVQLEYVEPGPGGRPEQGAVAPPPDLPALFVALEEQLGLKLEEARGPVTVLVIDDVQRPDLN